MNKLDQGVTLTKMQHRSKFFLLQNERTRKTAAEELKFG